MLYDPHKQVQSAHLWDTGENLVVVVNWKDPERLTLFELADVDTVRDETGRSPWTKCPVGLERPSDPLKFNIHCYDYYDTETISSLFLRGLKRWPALDSLKGTLAPVRSMHIEQWLLDYAEEDDIQANKKDKNTFASDFYVWLTAPNKTSTSKTAVTVLDHPNKPFTADYFQDYTDWVPSKTK